MLTSVLSDIKELRNEITRLCMISFHEKQGTSVRMSQQSNVDQNLVTQNVDIELIRNIFNQLHEKLAFVKLRKIFACFIF